MPISKYCQDFNNIRLSSIATIDVHKIPQSRHFGVGFDTMQQMDGADVQSNVTLNYF
jgi:hypothetical protein